MKKDVANFVCSVVRPRWIHFGHLLKEIYLKHFSEFVLKYKILIHSDPSFNSYWKLNVLKEEQKIQVPVQACWLSQLLTAPLGVNKNNKVGHWDQNQSINQYDLETLGLRLYFLQIVLCLSESKILMGWLSQDHVSIFHVLLVHKKLKISKQSQTLAQRGKKKKEKKENNWSVKNKKKHFDGKYSGSRNNRILLDYIKERQGNVV